MIKNIGGGDVAVEVAVEVINKVGVDGIDEKINKYRISSYVFCEFI